MTVLGFLTAAALLLPGGALPHLTTSCVAMVLPRSAAPGPLDGLTLEALNRFVSASGMTRDPRYLMAIYAPETRCHTNRCNAERTREREEMIRAHMIGLGLEAERIRLIGLEEGFARFGRVPERTAIVTVGLAGAAAPTCNTEHISRSD